MSKIKAVNRFVFVLRDPIKDTDNGLILPTSAQKKPNSGVIVSVGKMVQDAAIKTGIGKKALWHQHTGQEIDYEGETFTVLPDEQIIGVI